MIIPSNTVVLNGGRREFLQGTSGKVWRHFWVSQAGVRGELYWNLVGRGQRFCSTFYNASDNSHDEEFLSKMSIVRNPVLTEVFLSSYSWIYFNKFQRKNEKIFN